MCTTVVVNWGHFFSSFKGAFVGQKSYITYFLRGVAKVATKCGIPVLELERVACLPVEGCVGASAAVVAELGEIKAWVVRICAREEKPKCKS